MAYQAAFLKSFGLSQLLHFLQINATVLSIRVDWPPAVERLIEICRVVFVFDFHVFHVRACTAGCRSRPSIPTLSSSSPQHTAPHPNTQFKYTALVLSALLPLLCYYLSEHFWWDSAQWRRTYMTHWPQTRARLRRHCTTLGFGTALTCAALVSFGHLPALDAFGVTWAAAIALFLVFWACTAMGDLFRKLFVILETEEERVDFFLQVWVRACASLVCGLHRRPLSLMHTLDANEQTTDPLLAALLRAGRPQRGIPPHPGQALQGARVRAPTEATERSTHRRDSRTPQTRPRVHQIIYKAKHYLEDPEHAHEVHPAPWVTATILAGLYGLGLPLVIYLLMRRRRGQYAWVPDKASPEGGRYEAKPAMVAAKARKRDPEGEDGMGDDDAVAFSFLELEQQVRGGMTDGWIWWMDCWVSTTESHHSTPPTHTHTG